MKPRLNDPLDLSPQERRRRIVELLAIGLTRWVDEGRGTNPQKIPPKNGLASSGKSL